MVGIQSDLINSITKITFDIQRELKEDKYFGTESTIKNHFFRKTQNFFKEGYVLSSEVNIQNFIKTSQIGFYDFYAESNNRSYGGDVVIEFKINCTNLKLIKSDLNKLDYFYKKHKHAEGIFINIFTEKIDFNNLYKKIISKIKTKANFIFIAPSFRKMYFRKDLYAVEHLDKDSIIAITNSLKMCLWTPESGVVVRVPDKKRSTLQHPKVMLYAKDKSGSWWKSFPLKVV